MQYIANDTDHNPIPQSWTRLRLPSHMIPWVLYRDPGGAMDLWIEQHIGYDNIRWDLSLRTPTMLAFKHQEHAVLFSLTWL